MNKLIKRASAPLLHWVYRRKTSRVSRYQYKGLDVTILPGVFHPFFTSSTRQLIDYLSSMDVENKSVLEFGAWNALISFYCAREGARVRATDISDIALEGIEQNASNLNLSIEILYSDLFTSLQNRHWDLVIINPPYYPTPANDIERAMYCGKDFQYFRKLFDQLKSRYSFETEYLMILSEDCVRVTIENIARSKGLKLSKQQKVKNFWQVNFIYTIEV